jgi:hypothetical protein
MLHNDVMTWIQSFTWPNAEPGEAHTSQSQAEQQKSMDDRARTTEVHSPACVSDMMMVVASALDPRLCTLHTGLVQPSPFEHLPRGDMKTSGNHVEHINEETTNPNSFLLSLSTV